MRLIEARIDKEVRIVVGRWRSLECGGQNIYSGITDAAVAISHLNSGGSAGKPSSKGTGRRSERGCLAHYDASQMLADVMLFKQETFVERNAREAISATETP